MTLDPNVFDTYEAIATSKHITIANGTLVPIKGEGKITLSPNLAIKQVLHVPNLSTNLVSIHQLTKDLNCHAIFSPHMCEFQPMKIGHNVLYFLARMGNCPSGNQPMVACSSQFTSNPFSHIWLHH